MGVHPAASLDSVVPQPVPCPALRSRVRARVHVGDTRLSPEHQRGGRPELRVGTRCSLPVEDSSLGRSYAGSVFSLCPNPVFLGDGTGSQPPFRVRDQDWPHLGTARVVCTDARMDQPAGTSRALGTVQRCPGSLQHWHPTQPLGASWGSPLLGLQGTVPWSCQALGLVSKPRRGFRWPCTAGVRTPRFSPHPHGGSPHM